MKMTISKVLMVAGALLVFGAAGDSDTGALTFEGAVIKVSIGIALFAVGYLLHKKSSTPEQNPRVRLSNNEFVNSKQTTTPAYSNKFTTESAECQPYIELKIAGNEVTGC